MPVDTISSTRAWIALLPWASWLNVDDICRRRCFISCLGCGKDLTRFSSKGEAEGGVINGGGPEDVEGFGWSSASIPNKFGASCDEANEEVDVEPLSNGGG